jgi:hypothetical protein
VMRCLPSSVNQRGHAVSLGGGEPSATSRTQGKTAGGHSPITGCPSAGGLRARPSLGTQHFPDGWSLSFPFDGDTDHRSCRKSPGLSERGSAPAVGDGDRRQRGTTRRIGGRIIGIRRLNGARATGCQRHVPCLLIGVPPQKCLIVPEEDEPSMAVGTRRTACGHSGEIAAMSITDRHGGAASESFVWVRDFVSACDDRGDRLRGR